MYIPGGGHVNDQGDKQVTGAVVRRLQQTPPTT